MFSFSCGLLYIPLQNEEAEEEVKTVLHKEPREIAVKADKTAMEEYDERMLYKEEEVQKTFKVKRDLEETVMDREIKNVLEGEPFLTQSKVSMFVEDTPKEEEDDKVNPKEEEEEAKVLFQQLEELLEDASWQNLIQNCLQN